MINLLPETPAQGLLSTETEGSALAEFVPEAITWIAPFKGKEDSVSQDLLRSVGCGFPKANELTSKDRVRVVSIAPSEALVIGAELDIEDAATADQTDAWCILHLSGITSRDVLARLTSVDLRPQNFPVGRTARTVIGHMTGSVSRLDDDTWEIMVFRSMSRSAIHELEKAMRAVAAREALKT